jgi:hypothetical protein
VSRIWDVIASTAGKTPSQGFSWPSPDREARLRRALRAEEVAWSIGTAAFWVGLVAVLFGMEFGIWLWLGGIAVVVPAAMSGIFRLTRSTNGENEA